MTSPDQFSTDKTFSPSTIHTLQDKSKEVEALNAHADMQTRMDAAGGSFLVNILSGFLSIGAAIGDMLSNLLNALFGNYTGSNPALIAIQEGQTEFNGRVDLLEENGYCSMTIGTQLKIPTGLNRAVPFDTRIGPMHNAEPVIINRAHPGDATLRDEWCIRLDRPGLWQANCSMVQAQSAWESFAEILVLKPDKTPYTALSMPSPRAEKDGTTGGFGTTDSPSVGKPINLFKMFVVPTAGYYVQIRYRCIDGGAFHPRLRGGAQFSQFAVTQWAQDVEATGAPENPESETTLT